jgi:hypothetical protein
MAQEKYILDATAGYRMMWFNKQHPNCLFVDRRIECEPDICSDTNKLDLPDSSFKLIVWDPPQIIGQSKSWGYANSNMKREFGYLQSDSFEQELKATFRELWRLLEPYGVLNFKWSTKYRSTDEILKLFPVQPLFGQVSQNLDKATSDRRVRTVWFCFMKIPNSSIVPKEGVKQ